MIRECANTKQFICVDELWIDALKTIKGCGYRIDSRAGKTLEILGYSACLMNLNNTFLMNERRRLSPEYAAAELLWYLSNTRSIEMIKAYAPQYINFADVECGSGNMIAYGAYGHRLATNIEFDFTDTLPDAQDGIPCANLHQLTAVINLLKNDPNTRQAIITFWTANDLVHAYRKDKKDLPCTICLQFFIRDSKLHCITTMRSNDVWLGTPYDIFCFTSIQSLIALALDVSTGFYIHQAGSLHLYERNWSSSDEAIDEAKLLSHAKRMHNYSHSPLYDFEEVLSTATIAEVAYRTKDFARGHRMLSHLYKLCNSANILTDVVNIVANKWTDVKGSKNIHSEIFKEVLC